MKRRLWWWTTTGTKSTLFWPLIRRADLPSLSTPRERGLLEEVDAEPRDIDLVYRRLKAAVAKRSPSLEQPAGALAGKVAKLEAECALLI